MLLISSYRNMKTFESMSKWTRSNSLHEIHSLITIAIAGIVMVSSYDDYT